MLKNKNNCWVEKKKAIMKIQNIIDSSYHEDKGETVAFFDKEIDNNNRTSTYLPFYFPYPTFSKEKLVVKLPIPVFQKQRFFLASAVQFAWGDCTRF